MFKGFFDKIREAFRRSEVTEELFEDLEESLILGDVSVQTSTMLVGQLRDAVRKQGIKDVDKAYALLRELITELLTRHARPFVLVPNNPPVVILIVGVNGVGCPDMG